MMMNDDDDNNNSLILIIVKSFEMIMNDMRLVTTWLFELL